MQATDQLQAVLFDMDGTLVDTEILWLQAVRTEAGQLGLALDEHDQPYILGRAAADTAEHLHRRLLSAPPELSGPHTPPPADLTAALERRFAVLVAAEVVPMPGALALLDALVASGVTTALVSASPRHVVDVVLDSLGRHRFAVSFAAGETPRTKPAPDPYLAAAAALGVPTAHCVAVEDTPTGIASAEAAGCAVLAVPSDAPVEQAPGRLVVGSLLDVDLALLRALVRAGEDRSSTRP
ncbi:HAD family hydrolase [Streptacidiphilus carbonis]|jgi:HAD superfamily hydrolase (TIGR01509 family)|uniref:HAD family hydrolase n=1 Tax=Streptacidiphilus carbonis TaxID=105422 RepID=UPI0005A62411|nr:HAD family phosphatase [Streptacidiphilus carbonis]